MEITRRIWAALAVHLNEVRVAHGCPMLLLRLWLNNVCGGQ